MGITSEVALVCAPLGLVWYETVYWFGSKLPNIPASLFSRMKSSLNPSASEPVEALSQRGKSEGVSGTGNPVTDKVNVVNAGQAFGAFLFCTRA